MITVFVFVGMAMIILTLLIISSQTFAQTNNQSLVTYGKDIFGMSIKHPTDWEVKGYNRTQRDDRIGLDIFATLFQNHSWSSPIKVKDTWKTIANVPI